MKPRDAVQLMHIIKSYRSTHLLCFSTPLSHNGHYILDVALNIWKQGPFIYTCFAFPVYVNSKSGRVGPLDLPEVSGPSWSKGG